MFGYEPYPVQSRRRQETPLEIMWKNGESDCIGICMFKQVLIYITDRSMIVSPGFVYLSIKGLMPDAGFFPQYLCIKYRGALFPLFIIIFIFT